MDFKILSVTGEPPQPACINDYFDGKYGDGLVYAPRVANGYFAAKLCEGDVDIYQYNLAGKVREKMHTDLQF